MSLIIENSCENIQVLTTRWDTGNVAEITGIMVTV